jgi:hypothetical protein
MLRTVSKLVLVLAALFLLTSSLVSYEEVGSTNQQENYKVRDVVSTLYNGGLILTRDFSLDGTEYKIGNDEPIVYRINNENQYLLIYPYDSLEEREKAADNWNHKKAQERFPQEIGFGYTAKNIILIFIAKPLSYAAENPAISTTLQALSKTIFFELNKGTELLYRGESENWEAGLIVTYYDNWWKDEQGVLRYESWSNDHEILRYKGNPDEVGKYEVRFEHPGGASSGASDSFSQGSFDLSHNYGRYGGSSLYFGRLGGGGGFIPREGTFKVTVKWKDNLEETFELKPNSIKSNEGKSK